MEFQCAQATLHIRETDRQIERRLRRRVNGRTFSQNPRKRRKSHLFYPRSRGAASRMVGNTGLVYNLCMTVRISLWKRLQTLPSYPTLRGPQDLAEERLPEKTQTGQRKRETN